MALPLLLISAVPAIAAHPNVYVVDFATRAQTKDAMTEKLTYDFELAR